MTRPVLFSSCLAILALVLGGCGKPPRTEDPDTSNLRRIYQAIRTSFDVRERPPHDEAELKHWLGQLGEKGSPDDFLISRRDKKPFVIYYDAAKHPDAGDTIVAHEAEGVNGKKLVLTLRPSVTEMTDAEIAARKPGKK